MPHVLKPNLEHELSQRDSRNISKHLLAVALFVLTTLAAFAIFEGLEMAWQDQLYAAAAVGLSAAIGWLLPEPILLLYVLATPSTFALKHFLPGHPLLEAALPFWPATMPCLAAALVRYALHLWVAYPDVRFTWRWL